MNIPEQFKQQFRNEIKGKSEDEVISIIEKYSAIDFNGMQRFLVKKEFERLVEERGGVCIPCVFKKTPPGVLDELADTFNKDKRQITNILRA